MLTQMITIPGQHDPESRSIDAYITWCPWEKPHINNSLVAMNPTIESKPEISHFDEARDDVYDGHDHKEATQHVVMKSSLDRLSVFQAMRMYKRVVGIAMLAAFSASLDGYRKHANAGLSTHRLIVRDQLERFDRCEQGFHPNHGLRGSKDKDHGL